MQNTLILYQQKVKLCIFVSVASRLMSMKQRLGIAFPMGMTSLKYAFSTSAETGNDNSIQDKGITHAANTKK